FLSGDEATSAGARVVRWSRLGGAGLPWWQPSGPRRVLSRPGGEVANSPGAGSQVPRHERLKARGRVRHGGEVAWRTRSPPPPGPVTHRPSSQPTTEPPCPPAPTVLPGPRRSVTVPAGWNRPPPCTWKQILPPRPPLAG